MNSKAVTLLLLFVLSWITYLDRAAISSARSLIAQDLSLNGQQMGMVFSAFALGYALAQIPAGWFADRMGAKIALATVVTGWSLFTALTGALQGFGALLAVRFLFGIAEAGAYPGCARVIYGQLPPKEHGRANGFIFAGSRLGAAFAFPLLAWLLAVAGWRMAFVWLAVPGLLWALVWMTWYQREKIASGAPKRPWRELLAAPLLLAMAQYFCSNFTNFLSISWMNPYLTDRFRLDAAQAGWYTMAILLVAATAQSVSGWVTDRLYRSAYRNWSRRAPAMSGFLLSIVGLLWIRAAPDATAAALGFMVAAFGAELTISPSWAYCIDWGGARSGAVTGSMNMVGNLGSFVSANAFPLLQGLPGVSDAYFLAAALLNLIAAALWFRMREVS